jgi:hypothetical protein
MKWTVKVNDYLSYQFELVDDTTIRWTEMTTDDETGDMDDEYEIGDLHCSHDNLCMQVEDQDSLIYLFDDETQQAVVERVYSAYVLAVMDKLAVLRNRVKRKRDEE